MTNVNIAKFKHDCERCILIRTTQTEDVYVCPSLTRPYVTDSLIVRYSDEPSDYWSMWAIDTSQEHHIQYARTLGWTGRFEASEIKAINKKRKELAKFLYETEDKKIKEWLKEDIKRLYATLKKYEPCRKTVAKMILANETDEFNPAEQKLYNELNDQAHAYEWESNAINEYEEFDHEEHIMEQLKEIANA